MRMTRRGTALCALLVLTLGTTACRGGSDNGATARTTSSTGLPPTTTEAASVPADTAATTTTTAKPASGVTTSTTTKSSAVVTSNGATVADAPRDAHTENSDNTGTVTFANPAGATSGHADAKPDDPLSFGIVCSVATDGHGTCKVDLVNHVKRTAQFPGGLKITVTMQKQGSAPVNFVFDPGNVPSLDPGASAEVEGTFDLFEQGTYNYSATTTVAWP